jgi:5-methylcytosine-specific restriction endonuclease McrA
MGIRRYNALAGVPWQVMADIRDKIEAMEDGKEKTVLSLYFIDGVSSREIPQRLSELGIRTRTHTDWTARSVQNIVKKHFPELVKYRKPNPQKKLRRGHFQFIRDHKKVACGRCGSTDGVVWHHMIQASNGMKEALGDSVLANAVCLCEECHKETNAYYRMFDWSTLRRKDNA